MGIPLIETSRMVVFPFFYDHWMPSLLAKCHQIGIITFDTAPFDVSSNISASSGRRRMGIPPFDSSRFSGSNGSIFILLRPLDAELFDKTSKWRSTECDKNADLMKFCQLTRHPMVMEEWEYHHSTRLDEPVRMVVFSFVYDH